MIIPEKITQIARDLRKNMTNSEKLLWKRLRARKLGAKFLRQHPIHVLTEDSGQARCIISDFYCYDCRLIIELDGLVHNIPEVLELDIEKEILLKMQGFQILRFKNIDIQENIDRVIIEIQKNIQCNPFL